MSLLAMCLTVTTNGLQEECSEEPAAGCKTDIKLKKKQKKQIGAPSDDITTEETPLKGKKKKKRKLGVTAESPGRSSNLKLTSCFF